MLSSLQRIGELLLLEDPVQQPGCGGPMGMMPFILMLGIFWVLVFAPQRKERKRHEAMIQALKRGDEVVTQSGLVGVIADIQEPLLFLEIAKGVRVRVLKSTVARKYVEPVLDPKKAEHDKKKDSENEKGEAKA